MSHTGENEQGLRKIVDLTRFASIFIITAMLLSSSGKLQAPLLTG